MYHGSQKRMNKRMGMRVAKAEKPRTLPTGGPTSKRPTSGGNTPRPKTGGARPARPTPRPTRPGGRPSRPKTGGVMPRPKMGGIGRNRVARKHGGSHSMYAEGGMTHSGSQPTYGSTVADAMPKGMKN